MNIKKIVSSVVSATLLATSFTLPSYAEESFSTVQEFLTDVISLSTSEVESQSLDAAIEAAINKVTTVDDEVFYDGTSIGYWYSDSSNTLYGASDKSSTKISKTAEGYDVSPSLLNTLLTDLNNGLVDTYVPSTADWSKIISKYDVKLGNITIPADNWIALTASDEPINDGTAFNISERENLKESELGKRQSGKEIIFFSWLVDAAGDLYIQDQLVGIYYGQNRNGYYTVLARYISNTDSYSDKGYSGATYALGDTTADYHDMHDNHYFSIGVTTPSTSTLFAKLYTHSMTLSEIYTLNVDNGTDASTLRKVTEPSVTYTGDVSEASAYGIVYAFTKDIGLQGESVSAVHTAHLEMFQTSSCSKTTIGNSVLNRRLSKIQSLLPTDTIEVKATGWTINGHDNSIDNYITDQELNNAGDTADIAAVADIDALKFHVIVPTSLPIYVDDSNITYVANNADIINKSGAAVKLTGVNIVANAESGWTMVEGSPTKEMEGHEFNFSTTIEQNKVLDASEVYPFQYMANLSPTTEASSSLELATVMVTVDWATT